MHRETPMRTRPYLPADRQACLAIFDSNVPRFFRTHERPEFEAFLDAPLPGPYLVLEDEHGIIGCGGWAFEDEARGLVHLCWGMVRHDRHGQGHGRTLLRERLGGIRADPRARAIDLHTSQHTRGFYENLGFVIRQVVADGYAPGLDRVDMRLDLAAAPRAAGAPGT